jgi:hypothetical protein
MIVTSVQFKTEPSSHVLRYKNDIRRRLSPSVIDSPNLPVTLESRSYWLLGRYLRQLRERCAGASMFRYLRAEDAIFLEHYFALQLFAAINEAFSNAYTDKELSNIRRLVTKRRDRESFAYP